MAGERKALTTGKKILGGIEICGECECEWQTVAKGGKEGVRNARRHSSVSDTWWTRATHWVVLVSVTVCFEIQKHCATVYYY